MDSLTQITLGAAVGEAVLGRKVGAKAALWGAIAGTIPDLDVLISYADAVKNFTYHRGFSHSIFVLTLLTPLVAWLIRKVHPNARQPASAWMWLVWLCFVTHILLDSLTVYGTQVFWPIWTHPVGAGSIFIIDPLYTIPLLLGLIAALVMTRTSRKRFVVNAAALAISTLYLGWSLIAQAYVTHAVENSLAQQSVNYEKLLVTPSPFNTLLWRIVAVQGNGDYIEGYFSLLDGYEHVTLARYRGERHLLERFAGHWPVERLRWFTKGFYKVWQQGNNIVVTDLRMGAEPDYVFSFVVGTVVPEEVAATARQLEPNRDLSVLKRTWQRIWSADVG